MYFLPVMFFDTVFGKQELVYTFVLKGGPHRRRGNLVSAEDGNAGPRRSPDAKRPCNHCGGTARPLALLDSRQGKNFRLMRCSDCNKMSWTEEQ